MEHASVTSSWEPVVLGADVAGDLIATPPLPAGMVIALLGRVHRQRCEARLDAFRQALAEAGRLAEVASHATPGEMPGLVARLQVDIGLVGRELLRSPFDEAPLNGDPAGLLGGGPAA